VDLALFTSVLRSLEGLFDRLAAIWTSRAAGRGFSMLLIVSFLGTLVLTELERLGWLPPLPFELRNHFAAIHLAFTLLLFAEVLSLVFTLADSVADSVGKQFELLSLILLRKAFLEFSELGEPLVWEGMTEPLLVILADAAGALVVYALVSVFFRLQRHQPITRDEEEQAGFIRAKKVVAMLTLTAFAVMAVDDTVRSLTGDPYPFFEAFYLVLIFADILLVLISYRYSDSYHVVFRNSAFALSAVIIRLSLSAPAYVNAALAVVSILFALGVSYAYGRFYGVEATTEPPGPQGPA